MIKFSNHNTKQIILTLLLCGVGFFAMAQLEGASRLANYSNRLHWDGTSYTQEASLATDPLFYHTTSISDSAGDLLYYSNGMRLYNAQNESIDLGVAYDKPNECLLFKLDTCYALVVVDVVDSGYHYLNNNRNDTNALPAYLHIYYLHSQPKNIYTTIFDSVVYEVPFAPFIEAVKHANGKDYWIALLQDTKSLNDPPTVRPIAPHYYRVAQLSGDGSFDMGTTFPTKYHSYQGKRILSERQKYFYYPSDSVHRIVNGCQGKFAPSGEFFVFSDAFMTDVFDFDNSTGLLDFSNSYSRNLFPNEMSIIQKDLLSAGYSFENVPWLESNVKGNYGPNYFTFEITGDNKIIYLYSCVSIVKADTFAKKWIDCKDDPVQRCNQVNDAPWARRGYYFSALASYDLSSADTDYSLINKNAYLYYENCFDRYDISQQSIEELRTTSVNIRTNGGAFYDLQLMPDGNVYLINYEDEGGMSKLHTAGDSLRLEWIRDGNPTGFQGDAFSKIVGSYKLPGIKIFKDRDTIKCGEDGIQLRAKSLGADSMQWSTGEKSSSILANQEGWYTVSANTWYGVVTDSVYLYSESLVYTPMPDTIKCPELEMSLSPTGNFTSHSLHKVPSVPVSFVTDNGTYFISYVKDDCIVNDTFEVLNHVWPEITIEQLDSGCLPAEEIHFSVQPDNFDYLWNGMTESTPFATRETNNFLQVTSQNGCVLNVNLQASENCLTKYFLPNGFTPNGDGLNDTWSPQGNGILNYSYSVYNRWGEKLVVSVLNQPFDGMGYQTGYYLFLVQLVLKDGSVIHEDEVVFLLR